MTVYILVFITEISSSTEYAQYGAGFMDIFQQYEGQILAVTVGSPTVIESRPPTAVKGVDDDDDDDSNINADPERNSKDWPYARTVLMSFPSADAFNAWYHSSAYQELVKLRYQSSTGRVVMLDGLPGKDAGASADASASKSEAKEGK